MPRVVNRVAGGRPPSRKLWHIAGRSGGVDCGIRRKVYDNKPRRYAKDNITAHLTARSDKSVAYVTNNKRLRFVLLKPILTDTKHRAASLRQQSYLLLNWYWHRLLFAQLAGRIRQLVHEMIFHLRCQIIVSRATAFCSNNTSLMLK